MGNRSVRQKAREARHHPSQRQTVTYLIFGFEYYYPRGGLNDLKGRVNAFPQYENAIKFADKLLEEGEPSETPGYNNFFDEVQILKVGLEIDEKFFRVRKGDQTSDWHDTHEKAYAQARDRWEDAHEDRLAPHYREQRRLRKEQEKNNQP
jgi:hypothetical protein